MTTIRLDFLGIGAPKAATTSLHHYMRTHPELYLPEVKEQPFFTVDAAFEEGWDSFAAVAFHGAPSGRRYGKITPHYMGGPVAWRDATAAAEAEPASVVTARRIPQAFPDVKLIAMLRDPVERRSRATGRRRCWATTNARSTRRSTRSSRPRRSRPRAARPTDGHQHIVASEYGRVLDAYLRLFSREQLFVGSMTVMGRDPMALLGDLWRFLGVDDSHVPPNLGIRYQVRGTGRRIPVLAAAPRVVKGTPGLRHAWPRFRIVRRCRRPRTDSDRRPRSTSASRRAPSRWTSGPIPASWPRLRQHSRPMPRAVGGAGRAGAGSDRPRVRPR